MQLDTAMLQQLCFNLLASDCLLVGVGYHCWWWCHSSHPQVFDQQDRQEGVAFSLVASVWCELQMLQLVSHVPFSALVLYK